MNNNDFTELCRFIYGYGWQKIAAGILNINLRTIQYWARGDKKVPDNIAEEILAQAADKILGIRGKIAL